MRSCVAVCSHESWHLFYFRCVCVVCANCACVNKCADGIRVASAGKVAVGVAAMLCLPLLSQAAQRKCNMT